MIFGMLIHKCEGLAFPFAIFSSIFAKFSSMNVEYIQHPYPTFAIFIKLFTLKIKISVIYIYQVHECNFHKAFAES